MMISILLLNDIRDDQAMIKSLRSCDRKEKKNKSIVYIMHWETNGEIFQKASSILKILLLE